MTKYCSNVINSVDSGLFSMYFYICMDSSGKFKMKKTFPVPARQICSA